MRKFIFLSIVYFRVNPITGNNSFPRNSLKRGHDIGALWNTPVNQNLRAPGNPQYNYDMLQDESN